VRRGLEDVRLDGIAQRIQEVLDLAGLLPDRIERAGIVGHVCARSTKGVLIREVVTGCPSDLGHRDDPEVKLNAEHVDRGEIGKEEGACGGG
jgi:hypothetical protein